MFSNSIASSINLPFLTLSFSKLAWSLNATDFALSSLAATSYFSACLNLKLSLTSASNSFLLEEISLFKCLISLSLTNAISSAILSWALAFFLFILLIFLSNLAFFLSVSISNFWSSSSSVSLESTLILSILFLLISIILLLVWFSYLFWTKTTSLSTSATTW